MTDALFGGSADEARENYEAVRSDVDGTQWIVYHYEGKTLECGGKGDNLDEFFEQQDTLLADDGRAYAYLRFETGDEMSRRAKFAFVTWIGPAVGALKKAKVSTDKAFVKKVFVEFSKEFLCDTRNEVNQAKMLKDLEKASGAAYGTGR